MKQYYIIAALLLSALFASCSAEESDPVQKPAAPKFEFSIAGEAFSVEVDSSVVFTATRLEGTGVRTEWSVDGEKVAGTPSVTWKFTKLGVSNVHFEASNELGKVEKDYAVTVTGSPLDVSFSVEEESIDAVVGSQMEVSVTVLHGDKGTVHSWTLDGTEIGIGTSVSRIFEVAEVGTHTLAYNGINTDGMTASRTWTVTVTDLPLELSYTPSGEAVEAMEGDEVTFSAGVVHGSTGIAYSWKVNGTEVATTASYKHACSAQGTFTVSVSVTNAAGENASRSWTLTVVEKTERHLMFDNFENSALGESAYYIGNSVSGVSVLQVVENPYKTSANPSGKVLVDKGSMMTNSSSGYFKFKVNTMPDATTAISYDERKIYTKFRCKVYVGTTGFTPLLQSDITGNPRSAPAMINGIAFNPGVPTMSAWNAAIKTNDWNEFVYDFSNAKYGENMNHLGDTEQLQFRVFVDFNNNGQPGADVYFDDFEFVE